jgi:hypothetical protein
MPLETIGQREECLLKDGNKIKKLEEDKEIVSLLEKGKL